MLFEHPLAQMKIKLPLPIQHAIALAKYEHTNAVLAVLLSYYIKIFFSILNAMIN